MQKLFNNILLPVSLDSHALPIIEEAVEFSNQLNCNLHLIVTADISFSFIKTAFYNKDRYEFEIRKALRELHERVNFKLKEGLVLWTTYGSGDIQKLIADYSFQHQIDLICLSHKKKSIPILSNELDPSILSDKSNCPILTLKHFPVEARKKNIVLPIGQSLPVNKLRVASYLGRSFDSTIHLVSCKNKDNPPDEFTYLGKAYRVLKDYTDIPVVCNSFEGKNLNEIAFDYAKKINAGLIVMNPDPKPFFQGFINRLLSGFYYNNPRIPVLTVT